jgi:membrane protease YdiL (CAAX protease family)
LRFPYANWDIRRTILGLLAGLVLGAVFAPLLVLPFDPDLDTAGARIAAQGLLEVTLIAVAIAVAQGAGRPAALAAHLSRLGLRAFRRSAFGWLALAMFSYYAIVIAYGLLVIEPEQEDIARDLGLDQGVLTAVAAVALIAVVAPVAEEVFFRGMLFGGLRRRMAAIPASAISALVFGALHGTTGITTVPPLVVFGFVLALLYERTGSLVPGMIGHVLNNSLALLAAS